MVHIHCATRNIWCNVNISSLDRYGLWTHSSGSSFRVVFEVPTWKLKQRPIVLKKVELQPELKTDNESEDHAMPQFGYHEQILHWLMKKMCFDITLKQGLNFGKGRQSLLCSYYHRICRGWITSQPLHLQKWNTSNHLFRGWYRHNKLGFWCQHGCGVLSSHCKYGFSKFWWIK